MRAARRAALLAVVLIVAVVVIVVWQQRDRLNAVLGRDLAAQIDDARYQAVFLEGGYVFFGRLTARGDVLLLSDVFYLSSLPDQQGSEPGTLVKRGNELWGPTEPMVIPREQVVFMENLRDDSQVLDAIRRFKSGETSPATPAPTRTGGP